MPAKKAAEEAAPEGDAITVEGAGTLVTNIPDPAAPAGSQPAEAPAEEPEPEA